MNRISLPDMLPAREKRSCYRRDLQTWRIKMLP